MIGLIHIAVSQLIKGISLFKQVVRERSSKGTIYFGGLKLQGR
jgi:hypothetical protein